MQNKLFIPMWFVKQIVSPLLRKQGGQPLRVTRAHNNPTPSHPMSGTERTWINSQYTQPPIIKDPKQNRCRPMAPNWTLNPNMLDREFPNIEEPSSNWLGKKHLFYRIISLLRFDFSFNNQERKKRGTKHFKFFSNSYSSV